MKEISEKLLYHTEFSSTAQATGREKQSTHGHTQIWCYLQQKEEQFSFNSLDSYLYNNVLFSQTSDVMRVLPVDSESNRCIICVFCFVRQLQDFVLSFFFPCDEISNEKWCSITITVWANEFTQTQTNPEICSQFSEHESNSGFHPNQKRCN